MVFMKKAYMLKLLYRVVACLTLVSGFESETNRAFLLTDTTYSPHSVFKPAELL